MENYNVVEKEVKVGKNIAVDWKALVNPENEHVYSIVPEGYGTISHGTAIEAVDEVLTDFVEFGKPEKHFAYHKNGAQMRLDYHFPEVDVEVGDAGDKLNPKVSLFNSYDTSWSFQLQFGAHRLVCSNGLVMMKRLFSIHRRHTSGITFDKLKKDVGQGFQAFSDQTEIWKEWVDRITTPADYEKTMKKFGQTMTDKEKEGVGNIVETFSNKRIDDIKLRTLSYWMFYNIVMQYISHNIKSPHRKHLLERTAASAF